MKRTVSFILALAFVLTAFGVTSVFGGILGANAVFYDYYRYTQIPGFANFTEDELGLMWNEYVKDGHVDTTAKVDNAVTWTVKSFNQWKCFELFSGIPCNMLAQNHKNYNGSNLLPNGDMGHPSWSSMAGAVTVNGEARPSAAGKTIMGDNSAEGYDGISLYIAKNGEQYTGSLRITVTQVPSRGPYYIGSVDNGDEELAEALSDTDVGFAYETSGSAYADEDGYFHFNFKTDFKNIDWWSKDDDGISRSIYGDADGDGVKNGDNYYWPIPRSKIGQISGIIITFGQGFEIGDTVTVGDMRIYKDSRVHIDELVEYMDVYDALNPEAYTEDSYAFATEKYLVAYDIYNDPDMTEKYDQAAIDDACDDLRRALNALLPMFRVKSDKCTLKGFDVLTEEDMDEINDGGYSIDAAVITDDPLPHSLVEQSVCVIGGAFEGDPSYGWSCFSTAKYDDDGNPVPVRNVFEPEGAIDETAGLRFWIKYDGNYVPRPVTAVVGVGSSGSGDYFECDESVIRMPADEGYIAVAWSEFFNVEGDAELYDCLSSIDYFAIKIYDCEQMCYFISDLQTFDWSLQSADFTEMDKAISDGIIYLNSLDKDLYALISWQHVEEAIAAAQALHDEYGVTQEEADAAADEINGCIRRLSLIGDTATERQMNELKAAYYSAKEYWGGNYVSSTAANLRSAVAQAEPYINDVIKSDMCIELTDAINRAISELVPVSHTSLVTTILSPEMLTTRILAKANGHRSADTSFSLDKKYEKLPQGYSQALKMVAETDRTVDDRLPGGNVWDLGAINFKTMHDPGATPIVDDIDNPNAPGDRIGGGMGDLTGTSGIRLWISINDASLFENCTFRFGVSNCTEGPLFENYTGDIPFPTTGSGWIYLPWEYFELYDPSWTSGTVNLKEMRFWIFKVNGTVKQGGAVYLTGISAYKDVVRGTNEMPEVLNVTDGQTLDISESGPFVPDWNLGTATLNGVYCKYGTAIEDNGDYTLVITNGDKKNTVNFTVTGGNEVIYDMPVVTGVEDGQVYMDEVTITWDVGNALLDGRNFIKGAKIVEPGEHTLIVTNGDKLLTVKFTIKKTTVMPVITGVEEGGEYEGEVSVSWDVGTATLNGEPFEGGTITKPGTYRLVVTNEDKVAEVGFTVKAKTLDVTLGDFDGDGQITVADALAALRIGAKLVEETPESVAIGDVDHDGHVTVADALAILRVAAKLADHL